MRSVGGIALLSVLACDTDESPDGVPWEPTTSSSGSNDSETPADDDHASSMSGSGTSTTGPNATMTSDTAGPTTSSDPSDPTSDPSDSDDGSTSGGETSGGMQSTCSAQESELIELVNEYRAEHGLPAVPQSSSLCTVGHLHAVDLAEQNPHGPAECNLHSWSGAGAWSACCYTSDHMEAQCMWDKPRELTDYQGNGFENAAGNGGTLTPAQALDLWRGSPGHNDVILNQGMWADLPWGAVGAGIHEGYAVLWFGDQVDPAG